MEAHLTEYHNMKPPLLPRVACRKDRVAGMPYTVCRNDRVAATESELKLWAPTMSALAHIMDDTHAHLQV